MQPQIKQSGSQPFNYKAEKVLKKSQPNSAYTNRTAYYQSLQRS